MNARIILVLAVAMFAVSGPSIASIDRGTNAQAGITIVLPAGQKLAVRCVKNCCLPPRCTASSHV